MPVCTYRLKETYDVVEFNVRRTSHRLDVRFDVSGKVQSAAAS